MVVADGPRVGLSQPPPCGQQLQMRSTFLQNRGGDGLAKHRREVQKSNVPALEQRSRQVSRRPSARGSMPPSIDNYGKFRLDYRDKGVDELYLHALGREARNGSRACTIPQNFHCSLACSKSYRDGQQAHQHPETLSLAGREAPTVMDAQLAVDHVASHKSAVKQKRLPSQWSASRDPGSDRDSGAEQMLSNSFLEAVAPPDPCQEEGNTLIIGSQRSTGAHQSCRRENFQGSKDRCNSSAVNNRYRRHSRLRTESLDVAMAAAVAGVELGVVEVAAQARKGIAKGKASTVVSSGPRTCNNEGHMLLRRPRVAKTALWMNDELEQKQGSEKRSRNDDQKTAVLLRRERAIEVAEQALKADIGSCPTLSQLAAKLGMEVSDLKGLMMDIESAKAKLWNAHKKMVFKLAQQYGQLGRVPTGDLIAVGMQAIADAALAFDERRGAKLSTYTYTRIRFNMWKALQEETRTVQYTNYHVTRVRQLEQALKKCDSRSSVIDLAESLGWTVEAVKNHLVYQTREVSYEVADACRDTKDNAKMARSLAEESDVHEVCSQDLVRNEIEAALAKLPEKERIVIERVYGLQCDPLSQKEVGVQMKLSHQRISQLRLSGIRTLQRELGHLVPSLVALG